MDLVLDAAGLAEAIVGLEGMVARASELHPVFEIIAADFRVLEHGQFGSEGARGGAAWAPLLPSTVRARGNAHPILHETAALEESLTKPGAADAVKEITALSLTVGTSVRYASYHQDGTSRMAARPPVVLLLSDEVRWGEIVGKYIAP